MSGKDGDEIIRISLYLIEYQKIKNATQKLI